MLLLYVFLFFCVEQRIVFVVTGRDFSCVVFCCCRVNVVWVFFEVLGLIGGILVGGMCV